jgi:hypothetical protein
MKVVEAYPAATLKTASVPDTGRLWNVKAYPAVIIK